MPDVKGRVCLNHTDRPAVSRCETCFKPLCQACVQAVAGVHFCSSACADNYATSRERLAAQAGRDRAARRRRLVRRLLAFAVLAGLGWAACVWYQGHRAETETLLEKAGNATRSASQGVRNLAPGK